MEIVYGETEHICLIANYGHRKDHKDEDENKTLKFHCVDMDVAGHLAKAAAEAAKLSTNDI